MSDLVPASGGPAPPGLRSDTAGQWLRRLDPPSGAVTEWAMPFGVTSRTIIADGNVLLNDMRGRGIRFPNPASLDAPALRKRDRAGAA